MNWKTILVLSVAVLTLRAPVVQAEATRPTPEKMKKLSFPSFDEFELDNGLEGIVVEHHEQPVISINLVIKSGDALDPDGKEALASFVVDQLNKGTKTRDALQLAEWIESVGGSVNSSSTADFSGVTVTVLSEYQDIAYQYLQDILLNPVFPEAELDLLRQRILTSLEYQLSQPQTMAHRHLTTLMYGDHPYGKLETVESVESITRDDVVGFYRTNFVPNNVLILVVGDVKAKKVEKSVREYFGDWQPGSPQTVSYGGAPEAPETKFYVYNKTGAVQTEIMIGQLAPRAVNPDWPAILVANQVFGGGSSSRLYWNIRETRGWTYHVRSTFGREKDLGSFVLRTPVRTEVTDSVVVELMSELERIVSEPITQQELDDAKAYLVGNFPLTIETPAQIAAQVARYKLLGLNQADLEAYRDKLNAVTIADVSRVMKEYLHPERMYVVMVGDAQEIVPAIESIAEVEVFDIAGEPISMDMMTIEPVDYTYDTSQLSNRVATYALTVQSMSVGELSVKLEKKTSKGAGDVFAVSSSIAGMISMNENMEFTVDDLSPVSYKASMKMGPQSMGIDFAFTRTAGTGIVKRMEASEPEQVTFELVEGTILDGTLEYAIRCLPIEPGMSYRFPIVDSQTGSLQNADVDILEIVDVQTAAGDFSTYKVKIKRADGEAFFYFDRVSPHVLIKQEVPSQAMNLELISLAD